MSAPSRPGQQGPVADRGYGWSGRTVRQRHAGIGDRAAVERRAAELDRHDDEATERHGSGTRWPRGTARRHEDEAVPVRHSGTDTGAEEWDDNRAAVRAGAVPLDHEFAVPDDDDRAGVSGTARADIVLADDADEEARLAKEGLQFRNLPFGSLRQILHWVKTEQFNFSHIPIVRAMAIAFYFLVTVPVLTALWPIVWTYLLRFYRAVWTWPVTLVVAMFLNRIADWAVPDGLDPLAWSSTTRMVAAGAAFAFLVVALGVLRWGPEPEQSS